MNQGFSSSHEYLLAQLRWLDLALGQRVEQFRAGYRANSESMPAFYVSEDEVDELLQEPDPPPPSDQAAILRKEIGHRVQVTAPTVDLRLPGLAATFGLSPDEQLIVAICLAPELDRRYERLYGYLQDDLTRRRPDVDLALHLVFSQPQDRLRGRRLFLPQGPLVRHGLVKLSGEPGTSLLAHSLHLAPRIVTHLLDEQDHGHDLYTHREPADADAGSQVVFYETEPGAGPDGAAQQYSARQNRRLVRADLDLLSSVADTEEFTDLVARIDQEARLSGAMVHWADLDARTTPLRLRILGAHLARTQSPAVLSGSGQESALLQGLLPEMEVSRLKAPSFGERRDLWRSVADGLDEGALDRLASTFRLTPGEIQSAAKMADPFEGARHAVRLRFQGQARWVEPRHHWSDLVLPAERQARLRDLTHQARDHVKVYQEWGFARSHGASAGLKMLFAGPAGTGKTMAAQVLARELHLDLFAVDLSVLVSKYIGETEKNLARIFDAAAGGAVLFFDEADALFGRRTTVRDSHDRYANLQTSYLLQRLDEHPGVVVLATNLGKNMDEAFVRRLHGSIDFALPAAPERLRIWQGVWPAEAPLAPDVDLELLADRVPLAGGHLRNIALGAAFLAAAESAQITMQHLGRATRREYQQLGRVIDVSDFARPV